MQVQVFTFNAFMENTSVLYDGTKECVIVDPGCYELHEQDELVDFIEEKGLVVKKLLNTHCHIDHVLGNAFVKRKWGVELFIHRDDAQTLKSVEVYAGSYGFPTYEPTAPDHFMEEGDTIKFGNTTLEILFTPGHAPGHVVFIHEPTNTCIGGDVLFQGSIGRTDLPGGDFDTLERSIQDKMYTLPDKTIVYPGHGPTTTIGDEKKNNPFVRPK